MGTGQRPVKEEKDAKISWEHIFQAIPEPAFILDTEHNIITANKAAVTALGARSKDVLTGTKCYTHVHGTFSPPPDCPLEALKNAGCKGTTSAEMRAFGGLYSISCTAVAGERGVEGIVHIATDITKAKAAEEGLRAEEEIPVYIVGITDEDFFERAVAEDKLRRI